MDIRVTLNVETRRHKGRVLTYYYLRWYGSDGKRHGKSLGPVGGMSKRQAQKLRQAKEAELERSPGRRDQARAPQLAAYIESYYESRLGEIAPGTLELHRQTGRYLIGFFGEGRRIDAITPAEARAFKTALANGELAWVNERRRDKPPEGPTVDRHVREARTIFAQAVADEGISANPFAKLAGGKAVAKEFHYVSEEEFSRLLAAAKPAWKVMLGLARWAGLRAEEALQLPWRKVDWANSRIRIEARKDWKPKDGDARTVPIPRRLLDLLREAHEARDGGAELVIPRGAIAASNIWRDFGPVLKGAGLARYPKPMHALRKSCITDWASRFMAHSVTAWAGHSDYRTTATYYLRVSESDFRLAAGLPVDHLGGPEGNPEQPTDPATTPDSGINVGRPGSPASASRAVREDIPTTCDALAENAGQGLTQTAPQKPAGGLESRRKSRAGEGI